MYVCWEYDLAPMRIDTIVVRDVPKIVSDTSYVSGVKYFSELLGEKQEISKEEYYKNLSSLRGHQASQSGRDFLERFISYTAVIFMIVVALIAFVIGIWFTIWGLKKNNLLE